jgi:3-isopropylmalate dehydratase small subunit
VITLDLPAGQLRGPCGIDHAITLGAEQRELLLTGLDPIARSLQMLPQIEAFEAADCQRHAWLYLS